MRTEGDLVEELRRPCGIGRCTNARLDAADEIERLQNELSLHEAHAKHILDESIRLGWDMIGLPNDWLVSQIERLRAALALFSDEANWEMTPLVRDRYYWDHPEITAPWMIAEEALR